MGVGKKLVACLTDSLPLLSSVVVVEPSLRAFKSNGWVWPGLINDYVHIANPDTFLSVISIDRIDRFLPTGTKLLANILLKTMRLPICWGIKMVHRLFGVPTEINKGATLGFEKVDEFGPEIDILWQKAKSHFELTHVRNAEYLNWQFPNERGWNKFINRTGNKRAVKTWGLYTIKRYADGGPLDGLMALNIIDVFWDFDEPNVVRELLQYILYLGHKQQVDIIMISGNFPELKTELRRSAFMKIPSTVYVGFSDPQLGESGIEEIYSHSYITRGYADAAGRLGP